MSDTTFSMPHCPKCCISVGSHGDRRERIATAVLAGFAADHYWLDEGYSGKEAALCAVEWADALIAALDAEPTDGE